MTCRLNPVGRPVPLWEMTSWNDEWASRIVLLLVLVIVIVVIVVVVVVVAIVVQYFCGRGFRLSRDLWQSFLVGVFYANLYVITSLSSCRRTALREWCPAFIVTLSCCLPCLSLLPCFYILALLLLLLLVIPSASSFFFTLS
jgi:hypothetical protein